MPSLCAQTEGERLHGQSLAWKNSEKKSEKPLTSVKRVDTKTLGILRVGIAPAARVCMHTAQKASANGQGTLFYATSKPYARQHSSKCS